MYTFNTDTLLAQGYDHRQIGCQDYTLSGVIDNYAYAIVCDGCSSSPASDVGARLLAASALFNIDAFYNSALPCSMDHIDIAEILKRKELTTIQGDMLDKACMRETFSGNDVPDLIFNRNAEVQAIHLPECIINRVPTDMLMTALGDKFLDATLVLAVVNQNEYHAFMWGDGIIAVETGDGITTTEVSFPSGCPYYLSYTINPSRNDAYFKELGADTSKIITTEQSGGTLIESRRSRSVLVSEPVVLSGPTSNLRNISVMSDGMSSFFNPANSQRVSFKEIWTNIFDFKGYHMEGTFLGRKHNRLRKEMALSGNVHTDDISIATIHVKS